MKQNWFMIGDIHGDVSPIEAFYKENNNRLDLDNTNNYLILLGDVGINFYITGMRDYYTKKKLSEYPFTYICLRGNHEERVTNIAKKKPDRWIIENKYGGKVYIEEEFPNIQYLMDEPSIYFFNGYKTLSIPGAYSVDKNIRVLNNWPWFKDEQLSHEEMEYGLKLIEENNWTADLVISHTCPISYEPRDLFLSYIDQSEVDKTMEYYLDQIEFKLDYKRWAWGHFHANRLYLWDGDKEKLMLGSEVVNLDKFMSMGKTDYLLDIKA